MSNPESLHDRISHIHSLIEELRHPSDAFEKSISEAQNLLLNVSPDAEELVNGLEEIERNLKTFQEEIYNEVA